MNTEIKRFVNRQLNYKKRTLIVEIGAHYCEDTTDMLMVFDCPIIHCFEPDPRNIDLIKRYMLEYLGKSVFLHEIALSNNDGEADFYLSYRNFTSKDQVPDKYKWISKEDYVNLRINDSGSSSLRYGERNEHIVNADKIRVKTNKLDTWGQKTNIVGADFIWMDVQGAERDVIEGGRKFLASSSYIWTEYGEMTYNGAMDKSETIIFFSSMGFSPIVVERENILFGKNE